MPTAIASAGSSAAAGLESGAPNATLYQPPTQRPQASPVAYTPGPAWLPFGEPIEFDPSRTRAVTEAHGIRISVTPDAPTFSANDGLWVTTRLENVGSNTLHWVTDGCEIHVGLDAHLAAEWAYGADQPEPFGQLKDWMLERYERDERYPIFLDSVPGWAVDKGDFGCADLAVGHDLKPGRKLVARVLVRVNYWADHWYGRPPSGPVLLTGTFGSWYRGDEDQEFADHESLVVKVVVKLRDGRHPDWISPGQAIDVALRDPKLQAQILAWPEIRNFVPTTLVLDESRGQWIVGVGFERAVVRDGLGRPLASGAEPLTIRVDAAEARVLSVTQEVAPTHEP